MGRPRARAEVGGSSGGPSSVRRSRARPAPAGRGCRRQGGETGPGDAARSSGGVSTRPEGGCEPRRSDSGSAAAGGSESGPRPRGTAPTDIPVRSEAVPCQRRLHLRRGHPVSPESRRPRRQPGAGRRLARRPAATTLRGRARPGGLRGRFTGTSGWCSGSAGGARRLARGPRRIPTDVPDARAKASTLDLKNPLAGCSTRSPTTSPCACAGRPAAAARRRTSGRRPARTRGGEIATDLEQQEVRHALREELDRLPEKYRAPLVLCYFDGQTHDEAARTDRPTAGSMAKRLSEGLERLGSACSYGVSSPDSPDW